MIFRLISISGSMGALSRVTWREYFETQSEIEMILARRSSVRALRSSMQSAARVRHMRRFQSMASTSGVPAALEFLASSRAPVTWPNRRYSVTRGFSVARWAFLYACRVITQSLLFIFIKFPAGNQGLVISALRHVAADLDASGQNGGIGNGAHELGHAQREFVIGLFAGFA